LDASSPASPAPPSTEDELARTTSISWMVCCSATTVVDPAAMTWPAANPWTSQISGLPAISFRR
jgi:hypothetical protein